MTFTNAIQHSRQTQSPFPNRMFSKQCVSNADLVLNTR